MNQEISETPTIPPEFTEGADLPENTGETVGENIQSGVEIQEATPATEEEDEGIYLGDKILITSESYGKVAGEIYYIDESLIRVLPKGISNKLYDFPIIDNEIDPDLGVTDIKLWPGPRTSFVILQGFRNGQVFDAFNSQGEREGKYTVKSVNVEEDRIVLTKDGEETPITFTSNGIPRDLPFVILQIAPLEMDLMATEEIDTTNIEQDTYQEEDEYEELGEIEVPVYVPIREVETKDRVYNDVEQKGDLLSQFISMLDGPSQKNPLYIKRLRALVEVFGTMKNMVLDRDETGYIRGERQISYTYLADMLQNGNIPLSRPILRTKRSLFVDIWDDDEAPENRVIDNDDYTIKITPYNLQKSIEHDNKPMQAPGELQPSPTDTGYARHLRESFRFYPQGQTFLGDSFKFKKDSEFFRNTLPDEPIMGFKDLPPGYEKKGFKKKTVLMNETVLGPILQEARRGLEDTRAVGGNVILEGDRADLISYTLFPIQVATSIGSTRTGKLFEDIQRSSINSKSTKELVKEYGGEYESGDVRKILILDPSRVTFANVLFEEYFDQILKFFHPRGQGDLHHILSDLGMNHIELTQEQSQVFNSRVEKVIQKYRRIIAQLRSTTPQEAPEATSILPSFLEQLKSVFASHEPLRILMENLHTAIPSYKGIDLAHVGYMLLYAQDYFLAALSKDPTNIQREMVRKARDDFLRVVREAQIAKKNEESRGLAPKVNPCRHVKELELVRKTKDDGDRLALLARFVTLYQGGRKDNWVMCNLCNKELLCHHELLQVQQFLHPREHESIQKQIILNYAGGTYGGNHICRNCGKPIATLDYDTHIEFDDEGRPMMGRSELVDEDEIEKEKIDLALGTPDIRENDIQFENPDQQKIYDITRQICERIGVYPPPEDYRKIVMKSQEEYNELTREDTLAKFKARASKKAGSDQMVELQYYEFMAMKKVSIVACCTLFQIQKVMPEYMVRHTLPGCEAGFKGYPLDLDESPENSVGIKYLACAIAGMPANKEPWRNTSWMRENSITKRNEQIIQSLSYFIKLISDDAISQSELEKKRKYLVEIFGGDAVKSRASEKVRPTYKPYISSAFEGDADLVAQGAVRSATNGSVGDILLANKYISALHGISKQHATVIKNSPFANATCCSVPIGEPNLFYESKAPDLINYTPRTRSIARPNERQGWAFFPYQTRIPLDIRAEVQLDVAHRIFLSLCYQGDRKGLPHELGHDLMCDWCGLKILPEYYFPDMILNKKGQSVAQEVSDDVLRQSVMEQIGEITRERLDDLLATTHKYTKFHFYKSPMPLTREDFLASLQQIQPPPVENWSEVIDATLENLEKLRNTSTELEIAQALGPISEISSNAESVIKMLLKDDERRIMIPTLDRLASQSPQQIMEVLRSYFLVTFERSLLGYTTDGLENLPKEYDLSDDHRKELGEFLVAHNGITKDLNIETLGDVGKNKMNYFIAQISSILTFYAELRKSHIKFGGSFLQEIMRVFLYCPLASLLNMNTQPVGTPGRARIRGEEGGAASELKKFVIQLLMKYRGEAMSYSLETIKLEVAKANERDRRSIIRMIDNDDEDQKKVNMIQRRLGIGIWSQMAGKGVWKYDKEYDELERQMRERNMERMEMGIDDAHNVADAGYDNRNHQEDGDE